MRDREGRTERGGIERIGTDGAEKGRVHRPRGRGVEKVLLGK